MLRLDDPYAGQELATVAPGESVPADGDGVHDLYLVMDSRHPDHVDHVPGLIVRHVEC